MPSQNIRQSLVPIHSIRQPAAPLLRLRCGIRRRSCDDHVKHVFHAMATQPPCRKRRIKRRWRYSDDEALRETRERVSQALARKGSSQCYL